LHARFVIPLLLVLAAGCDGEASRNARLKEEALQRLESRPMRTDVPPEELHEANVALAEDVAALAAEMGEPPSEAEQAAVTAREDAAQAQAIATECTTLRQQVDALQRMLQDPEPAGGEPVDVAAVQAEISATESRIDSHCG
jgi:aryl-alcohol dehydrogenase-like predicted oxidoreductase